MDTQNQIVSFQVDHDIITPGVYVSRIDGDILTLDLRTRTPNGGEYMDNLTMHSVEHMFATYVRASAIADRVMYFGPMGCQTGFYLLVRDLAPSAVLEAVKAALRSTVAHEGEVFGASAKECGNYRSLCLEKAKKEAGEYLRVLEEKEQTFRYE